MKREQAKELLPIIEAFANGEDIECLAIGASSWEPIGDPTWLVGVKYRIKLSPREFWINSDGVGLPTAHRSLDEAIGWSQTDGNIIHVREVLNED